MKRYNSYKDSGVEWMNKIPSNWEKSRIRMVGDLYGGLTGKKGSDFNDEDNSSNKQFVPFTNIFNNTYISKDHFQYVNVEENENQNRVLKNDLFFLMSSESYEDLGKSSILLEDVEELYLNSFCKGFRIKDSKVYPLFLNYQLLGSLHKEMISIEGNGFTRINLRQDRLLDIPVFIPPLSEQQQIVSFLDTKTSLIDSLIEKTQRKIELLKEKRTSLINEVVTKGLNPNVEMKDSGIGWIGEISSHWIIKQLKHIIKNLNSGTSVNSEDTPVTNIKEYGVLKTSCVYGDIFRHTENKKVVIEEYDRVKCPVSKDTIIFSRMNTPDLVGSNGFIDKNYHNLFLPDRLWITEFYETTQLSIKWLSFITTSRKFRSELSSRSTGTSPTMKNITKDDLLTIKIPFPPISEQHQIVEYLDEQTQLIDNTISVEEKRIELLKEYRQSLISEVVTGKRKVV
jgi:type I restriction enzyme, S subunit